MRTSLAAAEVGPQIQGRSVMYGRPAARRHREHVFRARCLVHWCYSGCICCLDSRVERHTVSLYPCCRPPSVIITGRFYDVSSCATHVPDSVLLSSNVFLLSIRRRRKRGSWQVIWNEFVQAQAQAIHVNRAISSFKMPFSAEMAQVMLGAPQRAVPRTLWAQE